MSDESEERPERFNDLSAGDSLVAGGVLGAEELAHARELREERGGTLIDAILRLETEGRMAVSESALLRHFAEQLQTRFVRAEKLVELTIDDALLERVPARAAEKLRILPLRFVDGSDLHVVAAVPVTDNLVRDLQLVGAAQRVFLYVATPGAVDAGIRRSYYRDAEAFARLSLNGAAPLPERRPASLEKAKLRPSASTAPREGTRSAKITIREAEAVESLRRENRRFRLAQEFAAKLPLVAERAQLLERVLEGVLELFPADATALVAQEALHTRTRVPGAPFDVPLRVLMRVVDEPEGTLIHDAAVDARLSGSESVIARGLRSAMAVPLRARGRTHGVLYLDSVSSPLAFGPEDLATLQAIGAAVALRLDDLGVLEQVLATRTAALVETATRATPPPSAPLPPPAELPSAPLPPPAPLPLAPLPSSWARALAPTFEGPALAVVITVHAAPGLAAAPPLSALARLDAALTHALDALAPLDGALVALSPEGLRLVVGDGSPGAVDTAPAIRAALAAVQPVDPDVQLCAALDFATVLQSSLGPPSVRTPVASGPALDLAGLLAARGAGAEVHATAAVLARCRMKLRAAAPPPEEFPGRREPVIVYRIDGPA